MYQTMYLVDLKISRHCGKVGEDKYKTKILEGPSNTTLNYIMQHII